MPILTDSIKFSLASFGISGGKFYKSILTLSFTSHLSQKPHTSYSCHLMTSVLWLLFFPPNSSRHSSNYHIKLNFTKNFMSETTCFPQCSLFLFHFNNKIKRVSWLHSWDLNYFPCLLAANFWPGELKQSDKVVSTTSKLYPWKEGDFSSFFTHWLAYECISMC